MKFSSSRPPCAARWLARILPVLIAMLLSQASVHAHHLPPGFEGVDEFEHSHAMLSGIRHPLTGWDHCLALLAIGGVAAVSHRRRLLLPVMFGAGLMIGGCLGLMGAVLPQAPLLAAAVLLAAGAVLWSPPKSTGSVLAAATLVFGIWQGASHMTLVVLPQTLAAYAVGFVISSASLIYGGGLMATLVQRGLCVRTRQMAGAGLALAALVSAAASLS